MAALLITDARAATLDVVSPVYTVERLYKSMEGPQSAQPIALLDSPVPELLWITGYRAVMVGADGTTPTLQEFMCHSNLDFSQPDLHGSLFGMARSTNPRLFTLSQGQFDIRFPDGFGIPVLSTEPLSLTTQVLNHNVKGRTFQVRHHVSIDYVRDRESKVPMRPLFQSGVYGLARLNGTEHDAYFGVKEPDAAHHGSGCLLGQNASSHTYTDENGRVFTGHWVVKPGREVNHTLVTKLLNLPFDTTIHYIAVHLHPFAESLELRDLTTGETLFMSRARNFSDRIGLEHVDFFASVEGLPVYKDHEYELVSSYNNTTTVDQDSMAVMYLYLLDKAYQAPSLPAPHASP